MLKKHDFFDSELNLKGKDFVSKYTPETIAGDKVVIDQASGLMWHQGGSDNRMIYEDAQKWIAELNKKGYAGYKDWRLPTLEETMSLMEPKKNKSNDFYIDPVFDMIQDGCYWTSDLYISDWAWEVYFDVGYCQYFGRFDMDNYVRAVR